MKKNPVSLLSAVFEPLEFTNIWLIYFFFIKILALNVSLYYNCLRKFIQPILLEVI